MRLRIISELEVAEPDEVFNIIKQGASRLLRSKANKLAQMVKSGGTIDRKEYLEFKQEYDRLTPDQQRDLLRELTLDQQKDLIRLMQQEE